MYRHPDRIGQIDLVSAAMKLALASMAHRPSPGSHYPYKVARCVGNCTVQTTLQPFAPVFTLTSITYVRILNQLASGWSEIEVVNGPQALKRGFMRTSELVDAPGGIPDVPPLTPSPPTPIPSPLGPFRPGGDIRVERPLPSPVSPVPSPGIPSPVDLPPRAPAPGPSPMTPAPPIAAVEKPWTETLGEVAVLTSPLWGAVIFNAVFPK